MKKLYGLAPIIVPFALLWVIDTLWAHMDIGPYIAITVTMVLACTWSYADGLKKGAEIVQNAVKEAGEKYLTNLAADLERLKKEKANDKTN